MKLARARTRLSAVGLAASAALTLAACGTTGSAGLAIHVLPSSVRPLSRLVNDPPARPNIVFVLTDDLSSNLVRYMPHVLDMQRHGLSFRDYFVSDSLCCPSRASIFTGNFPHNTQVLGNIGPHGGFHVFYQRGEAQHTFAMALQRAGYLTGLMGKYLNGYLQPKGMVLSPGVSVPDSYVAPGCNEWATVGNGYAEFHYQLNEGGRLWKFGHHTWDYLTGVLARKGVRFIHAAARRHQPFFLELATFSPHSPYVPAPRDAHAFPGLTAPQPPNFNRLPSHPPLWLAAHKRLTSSDIARINRGFRRRAQAVQSIDRMIGEVQRALAATGLDRNTYIVFSSDNGLHMGQYRLMPGKMTAFDTDVRVPLIVTGPGVRPGSSTSAMAENIDLAKTFAAISKIGLPSDGHSLLPLLRGHSPAAWRDAILIEHHSPIESNLDPDFQQPPSGRPNTYEAMRTHSFLYVEYADGEHEFYDLRRDPFELHNIAGRLSRHQLAVLHSHLLAMSQCQGSQCWAASHIGPLPGRW